MSEPLHSERYADTLLEAMPLPRAEPKPIPRVKEARPASSRARAKAQAREAKPYRHSITKSSGATAAARKLNPETEGTGQSRSRHLEIVAERSQRRLARRHRARILLGVAGICAVVVAFGLVYLRVIAAQRQFTLDNLNRQVTQQEATYARLQLQVAQLNAPDRIVGYAESKLGMIPSTSVTILSAVAPDPGAPSTTLSGQSLAGDADWPQIKALMAGTP